MFVAILTAALAGLQPGTTVRLAPGNHDLIAIEGRRFDPPVTIDATGSSIRGLRLVNVSGVNWRGGTIEAPNGQNGSGANYYGVDMRKSQGVSFEGVTFTNALRAMVIADSRGLTVKNSKFVGLRSDGINVAGTSNVLIEGNSFTNFTPKKTTGTKGKPDYRDGDHPDAIQIWATPMNQANSDIIIRNNVIDGDTQGINTFGPVGDRFSRIVVENNKLAVTFPAGISVMSCDDCVIRGNTVAQRPGAKWKANVRTDRSNGKFCGNRIKDVPKHPANAKC